jgi:hypothetical protein
VSPRSAVGSREDRRSATRAAVTAYGPAIASLGSPGEADRIVRDGFPISRQAACTSPPNGRQQLAPGC